MEGVSSQLVLTRGKKISLLAPSHDENEIWHKAKFSWYHPILSFCSFPSGKCEKIIPNITKQNWNHYRFLFSMGSKHFFLNYVLVKMLTNNFCFHFLRSRTLVNFHQILKVRIVLKSELSWLFKNVQNFSPRCLKSWEIAIC